MHKTLNNRQSHLGALTSTGEGACVYVCAVTLKMRLYLKNGSPARRALELGVQPPICT